MPRIISSRPFPRCLLLAAVLTTSVSAVRAEDEAPVDPYATEDTDEPVDPYAQPLAAPADPYAHPPAAPADPYAPGPAGPPPPPNGAPAAPPPVPYYGTQPAHAAVSQSAPRPSISHLEMRAGFAAGGFETDGTKLEAGGVSITGAFARQLIDSWPSWRFGLEASVSYFTDPKIDGDESRTLTDRVLLLPRFALTAEYRFGTNWSARGSLGFSRLYVGDPERYTPSNGGGSVALGIAKKWRVGDAFGVGIALDLRGAGHSSSDEEWKASELGLSFVGDYAL